MIATINLNRASALMKRSTLLDRAQWGIAADGSLVSPYRDCRDCQQAIVQLADDELHMLEEIGAVEDVA